MGIYRYEKIDEIQSSLDPMTDMIVFLEYLTSEEYLRDILSSQYSLSGRSLNMRVKRIIPHMKLALAYINQSLLFSTETSFLPGYYGILNLLKVYILLGNWHNDLVKNRLHGISYRVTEKDSQSILTETLYLWERGAIPLFYRTITGKNLPHRNRQEISIPMREILPLVSNIGAEYKLAVKKQNNIVAFEEGFRSSENKKGFINITLKVMRLPGNTVLYKPSDFKALKTFYSDVNDNDLFVSHLDFPRGKEIDVKMYRSQFNPTLIYNYSRDEKQGILFIPCCAKRLLFPEELPIALLFFYMSSIVRYKPEFLFKLKDSKFWPLLSAARRHCILRMLNLTWSYIHKTNLVLSHD